MNEEERLQYAEAQIAGFGALIDSRIMPVKSYIDNNYVETADRISVLEDRISLIYQVLEEIKSMLSVNNVEVDGKELKDILSEYLEIG